MPSSNRTNVGLKRSAAATAALSCAGSNRTNVGLKPQSVSIADAVRVGSNRTNVGLKPGIAAADSLAHAAAQIGPMWD